MKKSKQKKVCEKIVRILAKMDTGKTRISSFEADLGGDYSSWEVHIETSVKDPKPTYTQLVFEIPNGD